SRVGGCSRFAGSFAIISVLAGCITAYSDAIGAGGPAGLGLGWPIVSAGTMLVALAMAELASAFPTAGALYHWSALLGGPGWGWFTASLNLVGQCAIVAAVDLGCAQTLADTAGLPPYPLFAAILARHASMYVTSGPIVAWLNDFAATVHVVGVVVLVVLLLGAAHLHDASWLVSPRFTQRPDGNWTLGFMGALLLGMWTFTGFDASAHVSEETHDP